MKKLFFIIIAYILFINSIAFADDNYDALYESAQPFASKLYNDIDPFQDEDNIRYAWSPYPLFRTAGYLYFKDITVDPGYYTLTPRTLKGNDYILFKQNGKVSHIIPVVKKEPTPINFYEANTPKMKMSKWQKFASGVKKKFYDTAKDSMRSTPPNSLVSVDMNSKYVVMTLYYGEDKYTVLFRRSKY